MLLSETGAKRFTEATSSGPPHMIKTGKKSYHHLLSEVNPVALQLEGCRFHSSTGAFLSRICMRVLQNPTVLKDA